jgi:hypothetical protein
LVKGLPVVSCVTAEPQSLCLSERQDLDITYRQNRTCSNVFSLLEKCCANIMASFFSGISCSFYPSEARN